MFATLSPIIADLRYKNRDTSKPKRKRQRLDHLSQEEKLQRRKLKNRVAAQSARDRKKVKMQDLEEYCSQLTKERNLLLNQNEALKLKNNSLEHENKELLRKLSLVLESKPKVSECSQLSDTIESAEFINDPQPKEQVSNLSRHSPTIVLPLIMLFVYMWTIQMKSTKFCINARKNCSTQALNAEIVSNMYATKWWGPHQKSWNPAMI